MLYWVAGSWWFTVPSERVSATSSGEDYEGGRFFVQPGKQDVGRQHCQESHTPKVFDPLFVIFLPWPDFQFLHRFLSPSFMFVLGVTSISSLLLLCLFWFNVSCFPFESFELCIKATTDRPSCRFLKTGRIDIFTTATVFHKIIPQTIKPGHPVKFIGS